MKKKIRAYDFCGVPPNDEPSTSSRTPKKKSPTNELTNKIIDFINVQPYSAAFRINTTGTWRQDLGKYVHSGSTLGVSDVIAIYHGRFIAIEIKQGADKLNHKQERFGEKVAKSLGDFIEVRSFEGFVAWWQGATQSIDRYDDAAIVGLKTQTAHTLKSLNPPVI